jgi:formamidopyrimidine-DNA glycosylase
MEGFIMIELPEARCLATQLSTWLTGKRIVKAIAFEKPHKFGWSNVEPSTFSELAEGKQIRGATASAHVVRILLENELEIACSEDVEIRVQESAEPEPTHLRLVFDDHTALTIRIKMYGYILIGTTPLLSDWTPYYRMALDSVSPLEDGFTYDRFLDQTKLMAGKGSVKQALATEQKIPGLGNGTLQDVLFEARISPKRKCSTLTANDREALFASVRSTLRTMSDQGGRDTTVNLFGKPGGYAVKMASNRDSCPVCKGALMKEAYLGGKVIYCPACQK